VRRPPSGPARPQALQWRPSLPWGLMGSPGIEGRLHGWRHRRVPSPTESRPAVAPPRAAHTPGMSAPHRRPELTVHPPTITRRLSLAGASSATTRADSGNLAAVSAQPLLESADSRASSGLGAAHGRAVDNVSFSIAKAKHSASSESQARE
jgi:hypothetical protein